MLDYWRHVSTSQQVGTISACRDDLGRQVQGIAQSTTKQERGKEDHGTTWVPDVLPDFGVTHLPPSSRYVTELSDSTYLKPTISAEASACMKGRDASSKLDTGMTKKLAHSSYLLKAASLPAIADMHGENRDLVSKNTRVAYRQLRSPGCEGLEQSGRVCL